jgi:hypothetical protein
MSLKKTKVVGLPTDKPTGIFGLIDKEGKETLHYSIMDKVRTEGKSLSKGYHLYYLSDDEIKEGDWVYALDTNTPFPVSKQEMKGITDFPHLYKKIIATTDRSLGEPTYKEWTKQLSTFKSLPEPSQAFIKKYCEKGGIDEVMVEYEEKFHSPSAIGMSVDEILKVSSDNTITIKSVKDSWSKIEVENLILQFANDAGSDDSLLHHYGGIFKDAKNWIKENL